MFYLFLCIALAQDNPSDKDINQGTLVVFNLDPSVSNDDLRQIFGAYGEVKEVIIDLIFLINFFPWFTSFRLSIILVNLPVLWYVMNKTDKGNATQEAP